AVSIASSRLSIAQGPAIRNSGRSSPASKLQSFIAMPRSSRCRALGQRRLDVRAEERMAIARRGGELRVELHTDEPRMRERTAARQLDDLGQRLGGRARGHDETCLLEPVDIAVVDLITMAMPLVDRLAVDRGGKRAGNDRAAL